MALPAPDNVEDILNSSSIRAATSLLRGLLQACVTGRTRAHPLRIQFHRRWATVIVERIFGESTTPVMSLACWMDAVDGCEYEEFNKESLADVELTLEEQRCAAAKSLIKLFSAQRTTGECDEESLFNDEPKESYLLRKELLPAQTRRILEATGMNAPGSLEYAGHLCADPLLNRLLARTSSKLQMALLPSRDPAGLRIALRDLIVCLFCNFVVSSTAKRVRAMVFEKPRELVSAVYAGTPVPTRQEEYDRVPLFQTVIGSLTSTHPYNQILFEFMDAYLPTSKPYPPHLDTELFVDAIISYWLLLNPPYFVALPGQSRLHAAPLPPGIFASGAAGGAGAAATPGKSAAASSLASPRGGAGIGGHIGNKGDSAAADTSSFILPRVELLDAIALVITLQWCDDKYYRILTGERVPHGTSVPVLLLASQAASSPHTAPVAANLYRYFMSTIKPSELHRPPLNRFPDCAALPPAWAQMLAPLFHFLRNNLEVVNLENASGQALYSIIIDLWLMVLTPWRARPRLKSQLPDVEDARHFNYAAEASRVLAAKATAKRAAIGVPAAGQCIAVTEDAEAIATAVRLSEAYRNLLPRAHDFQSGRDEFARWRPYVTLHYSFYTYLLNIVLRRIRQVQFCENRGATPLLRALERILDVFEPDVVQHLSACEAEVNFLFASAAAAPTTDVHVFRDPAAQLSAGQFSAQPGRVYHDLSICTHLFAHQAMLKLPPEVHPASVLTKMSSLREDASELLRKLKVSAEGPDARAPRVRVPLGVSWRQVDNPVLAPLPAIVSLVLKPLGDATTALAARVKNDYVRHAIVALHRVFKQFLSLLATALDALAHWLSGQPGPHWNPNRNMAPVDSSGASQIPSDTLADRIQLAADRLCMMFPGTALPVPPQIANTPEKQLPEPLRFFGMSLGASLAELLTLFGLLPYLRNETVFLWRWLFMLNDDRYAVRSTPFDLMQPELEADQQLRAQGILAPEGRAQLLRGERALGPQLMRYTGVPALRPVGTWESALLVRWTHWFSVQMLRLFMSPEVFAERYIWPVPADADLQALAQASLSQLQATRAVQRRQSVGAATPLAAVTPNLTGSRLRDGVVAAAVIPPNYFRRASDIRIFTLLLVLLVSLWKIGFFYTALWVVAGFVGLRVAL